jgi:two-component system phosphate regulon sensor histidine kinase PhoR
VLVKDILVLTQVESGDIKMQFEKINIVEIIDEIFEQLEEKAKKRDITFHLKPKGITSAHILADKVRITQVLSNLISNAIKYGNDRGRVTVELFQESKGLKIQISDNGIGISQENIPRIFERFYRVDKSRSRAVGGTGLGLAIVKHILNAHKTTIEVSSKLDKGTTFTFVLPQPSEDF